MVNIPNVIPYLSDLTPIYHANILPIDAHLDEKQNPQKDPAFSPSVIV